MKIVTAISFLLIFVALFIGCEKEATNVDLPKVDPKLVVYCYISPSDSLIIVNVSKSIPFFGKEEENEDEAVRDAEVWLSTANQSIKLPFDDFFQRYAVLHNQDFPILPGKTYTLSVSAPNGLSCHATTTVPKYYPADFNVTVDSTVTVRDFYEDKHYKIKSSWKDEAGVSNYYHLAISVNSHSFFVGDFTICSYLRADTKNNGQDFVTFCEYELSSSHGSEAGINSSDSAYLLSTDLAYYKYHESYFRYEDEDPFAEPVQIYTNVEGGLGCFGSYVQSVRPLLP